MRSGLLRISLLLAISTAVFACRRAPDTGAPVIAVSVVPQAWFVERLADGLVRVETMLPPGANPHTYEPRMDQLAAVSHAVIYVEVGHPAFVVEQSWVPRLVADNPGLTLIDSSAGAKTLDGDPHVWLSPRIVRVMIGHIADALIARLPDRRTELERRRFALLQEVDDVDHDVKAALANVKHKRFYVFHPAWGYFAADYGLTQVAIEQNGREPDARAIEALVKAMRADDAHTIFVSARSSHASATVVAYEAQAHIVVVDELAKDWAANLRSVAKLLAEALS